MTTLITMLKQLAPVMTWLGGMLSKLIAYLTPKIVAELKIVGQYILTETEAEATAKFAGLKSAARAYLAGIVSRSKLFYAGTSSETKVALILAPIVLLIVFHFIF